MDSSLGNLRNLAGPDSGPKAALALPSPAGGAAAPAVLNPSPLQIAKKHKGFIAFFLLAGLIAGVAYTTFATPLYTATATVEVLGINTAFMGMDKVDQQVAQDLAASTSNIQTQVKLLTSRTLLGKTAQRMNLESAPIAPTPQTFFTRLRSKVPVFRADPLVSTREAVMAAALSTTASAVGATRLIEIKCETTSPQVAANFVNTLAAEHVAQSLATRAGATQKTSQWLDSQLEESKAKLNQAEQNLHEFVQKSGMDFFPEQSTLADSKVKALQMDVSAVQADRVAKQSRWELARNTPIENLPDVVTDPTLQALKLQIGTLKKDIALLTSTLTPEHYKVKRIQAQLTEAEQAYEKEKAGVLLRIKSDFEESQRRENLLTSAYNRQTHTLAAQTDKSAEYASLKRAVDSQQQMYNLLVIQSNQASLNALAPASNIRLADTANVPRIPTSPAPVRDIPLATMLGGVFGYGWLFLMEKVRQKKATLLFDAPGHTSTILGVPELGVIPSAQIVQPRITLLHRLTSRSTPDLIPTVSDPVAEGSAIESVLAGLQVNKSTLLAESFRQTLVSLLRTTPKDHSPVYVITSAYPGEGKTTLSANLASAMADIGKKVLLVDSDLRRISGRPVTGNRKGCAGLSDILSSGAPIRDIDLTNYLQDTKNENLKVLTHGVAEVETPALLFFSPRVQQLIGMLQSKFDCVIFDTAPALTFPDARLWGRHADGVVLVVRSGVTTREGASSCCQRFLDDGIPVLGTILNDWEPSETAKNAYAYYATAAKEAV